jgi:chromosome segregation ATPase
VVSTSASPIKRHSNEHFARSIGEQLSGAQADLIVKYGGYSADTDMISKINSELDTVRDSATEIRRVLPDFTNIIKRGVIVAKSRTFSAINSVIDKQRSEIHKRDEIIDRERIQSEQKLLSAQSKLEQCSDVLNSQKQEIAGLNSQIAALKRDSFSESQSHNSEIAKLHAELEIVRGELREAKSALSKASDDRSRSEREKVEIECNLEKVMSKLRSAESSNTQLTAEIRRLEEQCDENNRSLGDLTQSNQSLSKRESDFERKLRKLEREIGEKRTELESAKASLELVKEQRDLKIAQLNDRNGELTAALRSSQSSGEAQNSRIAELGSQLKTEQENGAKRRKELEVEIEKKDDEIQQLKSEARELKRQIDELGKDLLNLKSATNESIIDKDKHNFVLKNEVEKVRKSESELKATVSDLQSRVKASQQQFADSEERLRAAQSKLTKEKQKHVQTVLEKEALAKDKEALERRLRSVSDELQEREKLLRESREQYLGARNKVTSVSTELEKVTKERDWLRESVKKSNEEISQQIAIFNEIAAEKEGQISKLKENLKEQKAANDAMKSDLRLRDASLTEKSAEISRLGSVAQKLESELNERAVDFTKLNLGYQKTESELSERNAELSKTNGLYQKLLNELKEKETEIRSKSEQISEMSRNLAQREVSLATLSEEIAAKEEKIVVLRDALKTTQAGLRVANNSKDEYESLLSESSRIAEEEVSQLKKSLKSATEDVSRAQKQNDLISAELERNKSTVKQLNEQLAKCLTEIETLQLSSHELFTQKHHLEAELTELRSTIAEIKSILSQNSSPSKIHEVMRSDELVSVVRSLKRAKQQFADDESFGNSNISRLLLDNDRLKAVLERTARILQIDDYLAVSERVMEVVAENQELAEREKRVLQSFGLSSPIRLQSAVKEACEASRLNSEISKILCLQKDDILIRLSQLNKDLNSAFPLRSAVTFCEKVALLLRECANSASAQTDANNAVVRERDSLLHCVNTLLGVLSRSPRRVILPLSASFEERLCSSITEMKKKAEASDSVVRNAESLGFYGSSLEDAVEFIAERSRSVAVSPNSALEKKVRELEKLLGELEERNVSKEAEMLARIEAERGKWRKLSETMENEKRVRDELVLMMSGIDGNFEFLQRSLTARELRVVSRFEEERKSRSEVRDVSMIPKRKGDGSPMKSLLDSF